MKAITAETKNESQAIEHLIYVIKNMPDLLMEHDHGITLDFSCQNEDGPLLKAIREQYRVKSQWLEVYWLDRTELLFELTKTWKKDYKFYAKITDAFWKLAKEIRIQLAEAAPDVHAFTAVAQLPKALTWTFLCERYLCENQLKNSGYIGNSQPVGKGRLNELACQHYDELETVFKLKFSGHASMPPTQALEQTAAGIAKLDPEFKNGPFLNYTKVQRRCWRDLERSPLKVLYLQEDGTPKIMDRGHDTRKPKTDKRGFG